MPRAKPGLSGFTASSSSGRSASNGRGLSWEAKQRLTLPLAQPNSKQWPVFQIGSPSIPGALFLAEALLLGGLILHVGYGLEDCLHRIHTSLQEKPVDAGRQASHEGLSTAISAAEQRLQGQACHSELALL